MKNVIASFSYDPHFTLKLFDILNSSLLRRFHWKKFSERFHR